MSQPTMVEQLQWFAPGVQLPDDDTTVMIETADFCDQPVWLGYYNAGEWLTIEGDTIPAKHVVQWADMPRGTGAVS